MKDFNADMQQIEKFLDGKMTSEERLEFEKKVSNDESLKMMMTDMSALIEGIKTSAEQTSKQEKLDRLKFFAEINDIERMSEFDEEGQAKIVPFYRKPWILSAAASILLVMVLAGYFMRTQTPSHEKLYLSYFEPFDNPGSGVVRGDSKITLKTRAYGAYDNGQYQEAAKLFEQLIADKDDAIARLCLGNAYMAQNEFAKAEKNFTEMLRKHTELITQAKWYLALTYLKENKMERAKSVLWEISKSSTYGEKAQKLLSQLD